MEFMPVQILEEQDLIKVLTAQHVYSIKDLQDTLAAKTDKVSQFSKEIEAVLQKKLQMIQRALKEGMDEPRDRAYADELENIPGVVLSLNGINLITGKRSSGKTTFAFSQMLDAFIAINAGAIEMFLESRIDAKDLAKLINRKMIIFLITEVAYFAQWNQIAHEKGIKFAEKYLSKGGLSQATGEKYGDAFAALVRLIVIVIKGNTYTRIMDYLNELIEMLLQIKIGGEGTDVFGIVIDNVSAMFNKIDSLTIKSDVRNFGKLCNKLSRVNNVPVIVTDSLKVYYDEDNYDELKLFTPNIIYSCVSDIFYMMRVDHNIFKVAQIKSSKELIPAETTPH